MIFEPKTFLYVNSMPKPQIQEKKFLIFSKWRIFSNSLLFSGKTAFKKISAHFVTGFQKLFFHLKALQTRMQIDVNNFFQTAFLQLKWFRRYTRKTQVSKTAKCVFCYSHCIWLHKALDAIFYPLVKTTFLFDKWVIQFDPIITLLICYFSCQDFNKRIKVC